MEKRGLDEGEDMPVRKCIKATHQSRANFIQRLPREILIDVLDKVECNAKDANLLKLVCKEWHDIVQTDLSIETAVCYGSGRSISACYIGLGEDTAIQFSLVLRCGYRLLRHLWQQALLIEGNEDPFFAMCDLISWTSLCEVSLSFSRLDRLGWMGVLRIDKLISCLCSCRKLSEPELDIEIEDVPAGTIGFALERMFKTLTLKVLTIDNLYLAHPSTPFLTNERDDLFCTMVNRSALNSLRLLHYENVIGTKIMTEALFGVLEGARQSLEDVAIRLDLLEPFEISSNLYVRQRNINFERLRRFSIEYLGRKAPRQNDPRFIPINLSAPLEEFELDDNAQPVLLPSFPHLLTQHLRRLTLSLDSDSNPESHLIPHLCKCTMLSRIELTGIWSLDVHRAYPTGDAGAAYEASLNALIHAITSTTSIPVEVFSVSDDGFVDPDALLALVRSRNDVVDAAASDIRKIKQLTVCRAQFDEAVGDILCGMVANCCIHWQT